MVLGYGYVLWSDTQRLRRIELWSRNSVSGVNTGTWLPILDVYNERLSKKERMGGCVSLRECCGKSTEVGLSKKCHRQRRRVIKRLVKIVPSGSTARSYCNPFRGDKKEVWFDTVIVSEYECDDDFHSIQDGPLNEK